MGKTVVSWAPIHGQSATTSNISSLAATFAMTYPQTNLITHTQLTFSSMESLFGKELIEAGFEDSGLAALERLAKSSLLKPEAVMDYTEAIYQNRLDILGGRKTDSEHDSIMEMLLAITKDAYDLVWVDAHSGTRNNLTNRLLEQADLVLVNLPQNRYVLDRFFKGEDFPEELKDKKFVLLISSYDESSSFSIRKIKRRYKIKQPIFEVPYSMQFKDAANSLKLAEFFYRNREVRKDAPTYEFISSLKDINKYIAKETGFYRKGIDDREEEEE